MKSRTLFFVGLLVTLSMLLAACAPAATAAPTFAVGSSSTEAPTAALAATEKPAAPKNPNLILATTTSTQDSGLLDTLIPLFEKQTGYKVKVIAVGSGQALQMGQQGNADVLLVHSAADEKNYMAQQYGKDRMLVMHNDFIVVGPTADPAKVKGSTSAVDAFRKIAAAQAPFISRGDKSGTNAKELALWKSAGIDPSATKPKWYVETGQGKFAAGSTVIRMDQPYSRMADMMLDSQYYKPTDPQSYDDTGWQLCSTATGWQNQDLKDQDGLKLFVKETVIPSGANKIVFIMAPMVTFMSMFFWRVLPAAS